MAEQAFRMEDMVVPHLFLTIDAMDKSKWLVPRSLESTKRLSQLWRPALHVVGVLIAGVLEYFAVVEADVHGDSDTQQTLLSRAMELAEVELRKRGKDLPWKVVFHSDNTSKEGRNSFMLQFAAALVSSGRFAEASLAMFAVGHTHNRLDQRFSVIGNLLSRAERLETPGDYIMHLQLHYKSARGVPVFFEEVGGAHYWRKFFATLEKHFKGVTGSKNTADAAHVLRVVRRDMVAACAPEVDWVEDGNPEDPVLLAKHWLHSKALSQPPTTLWATKWQWDFRNLEVAPRMVLNDESRKQYQKTADQILAQPWNMQSAATYILGWLQRNQSQSVNVSTVPEITFMMEGRDFLPAAAVAGSTWKDFAPEGAVFIEPVRRPERQILEQARKRQRSQDVPQLAVMPCRARAVMNAAQSQEAAEVEGPAPKAASKRPAANSRSMKRPSAR